MLLQEQHSLTAVEAFSRVHDANQSFGERSIHEASQEPDQAVYYRRLMPATPPREGEQYAFEVDLDACSGCKACVVACHTLNGLEETESWRKVGTLTIGEDVTDGLPIAIAPGVQHVTTACHHCEDPGCLNGCPVKAYDKDPVTGIVRHLDDQCIGCKYCTMMCPYEVPKYSKRLGIVRKCDMCHQRLSVGEAPACVQSCPNEAISIRTVVTGQSFAISDRLVAGAPVSSITRPTTRYQTKRGSAIAEAIPQDASIDPVAESHWPLAAMLVATQISVSMILLERVASSVLWIAGESLPLDAVRITAAASLIIALVGLNIAPLHLGQPLRAWRVFLGLRTSWLSREAVILGKYVGALSVAVVLMWLPVIASYTPDAVLDRIPTWITVPGWAAKASLGVAVLLGVAGLYSSAMIYIATKRKLWRATRTLPRFFGTGVVVGAVLVAATIRFGGGPTSVIMLMILSAALAGATKLMWEMSFHLRSEGHGLSNPLDVRSHRLATTHLNHLRKMRLASGWAGIVLCLVAMGGITIQSELISWTSLILAIVAMTAAESLERLLYFMSVVYDRMPGTLR
ncbi:Anaerobic dimethyl sulfoxide reductase chain B [Neorhodopirellula pilleata]|uniref:Anaerobic dimethyl sulfoxide reductase chain B n=2 Tax=Neorhodopirellula pilleata TaxID=2714738 RepID=A0A5C6AW84_9BACT|nr:Anaerobic dimethyl sulfoxide reductase chain B [Neorhodopirellula pilleata]